MKERDSSERTQRVRIGLTGLAFVFLLVLLGTAISRSGEDPAARTGQDQATGNEVEPEEPLAQIGVAPGQSSSHNGADAAAPTP